MFFYGAAYRCLLLSTIYIGSLFGLCAWVDVIDGRWSTKNGWRIPTALYPFSLLVVWDLVAVNVLDSDALRKLPVSQHGVLCLIFVVTSILFLIATRVLVRRNSGPGRSLVAFGSMTLLVTSPLPFVLTIFSILDILN
jgi:hypothetical protein